MGSMVFEKLTTLVRWLAAAAATALALTACGGGSGDAASASAPSAASQQDQVAAIALAQQSVTEHAAPARPAARAAVSPGLASEDFENGMADWQNWGNAQVVAGAGTSGSKALQVGTGAGGAALRVPGVVPGTMYRLTAQVRTTNPDEWVGLGVNFYSASGSELIGANAPPVMDTSYRTLTFDALAPQGTAYAIVWVWKNAGTGYAYVDDIALGLASYPPEPVLPLSNLLSNGSFEQLGAYSNGHFEELGAYWQMWGSARVASVQAHSGSLALITVYAAGGAGQTVGGIVPGTTYRFIAHAMVSYATEPVLVGVYFLDAADRAIEGRTVAVTSPVYAAATFDITAPPGAVRAVVFAWDNGGRGFGIVDDFVFGVAPASAPQVPSPSGNLVVNGGFESDLASWQNWGNAIASPTQSAAGSMAVQVGTQAGGVGQNVGGIVAGSTYRLSAQVKVSSADEIGYVGVKFLDDAGVALLDSVVPFQSTTYSTAQLDITAPPNATRALVYVWKNNGSGFAYADEVVLTQTAAPAPAQ